jgi:putative endonuclease
MIGASKQWHVYIVRCADGTLYTGVAIDVVRRVAEHNGMRANGARAVRDIGARYTRSRRPVKLAYQELAANRAAACKREYRIKQLTRREKIALINAASRMISTASKKDVKQVVKKHIKE